MIIMAVDYGDARTGIAICDKTEMLASPLCTINESYAPKLTDKICSLAEEKKADMLVVGLPVNMDGTRGFRAEAALALAELLREKSGLPVEMWDERLTTIIAHSKLRESGKKEKNHKKLVDALAAAEILDGFITARKNRSNG